jgi:hypothetical protein
MVSRRTAIAGGAGAAVLAALGYRAWDRGVFSSGDGPAFEPWREWNGHAGEDPARRPLHAAILAASAHNTQPWLFEPHEDSITVYADLSRNLGAADPFRRELHTSIGCSFENICIASNTKYPNSLRGLGETRLAPNPRNDIVRVMEVAISPDPDWREYSDWRAALKYRHTYRGAMLPDKPADPKFIDNWESVWFVTDPIAKHDLGDVIIDSTERFIADKDIARASSRWFRTGRREIDSHRDGVTTDAAGLSTLMNGLAKMLPDPDANAADKYWLAATRDVQIPSAAAFGVVFVPDRLSLYEAVATGSLWQSIHLDLTARGMVAQPLNQPIEMMDRDYLLGQRCHFAEEIRKIVAPRGTGEDGDDIAFIFRIGYAKRPAIASPRRALDDVIVKKA